MSNYDFLQSLFSTIPEDLRNITLAGYVILIATSIIASLLISHLYIHFFDSNTTGSRIYRSFPLMGPAITTIFITVQFSLPLSLGLLGALSIVRFRTPIKEPEEIGFILLVIACSISIATFNIAFSVLLYVAVFVMLTILKFVPGFGIAASTGVVLNVTLEDVTKSNNGNIEKITDVLTSNGVKHTISSFHLDGDKLNASILLRRSLKDNSKIVMALKEQIPDLIIDYYRR